MFPFHQSSDSSFQILDDLQQPDLIIPQDQITGQESQPYQISNYIPDASYQFNEPNICNDHERKIVRRELEKQRRQRMANLCVSLRSLLPFEYIKGKRSFSDHISEATNYIKHLKKEIQELQDKRDELKHKGETNQSGDNIINRCLKVTPRLGGVEILIDSSCFNEEINGLKHCLSQVIHVLEEEGHGAVNCMSSRANGSLIHCVRTKVGDLACLDLPRLQQKLSDVILSLYSS